MKSFIMCIFYHISKTLYYPTEGSIYLLLTVIMDYVVQQPLPMFQQLNYKFFSLHSVFLQPCCIRFYFLKSNFFKKFTYFYYLKRREGGKNREAFYRLAHSQMHTVAGLGQAEARCPGLHPDPHHLRGRQVLKYLFHRLLPPNVQISRKLNLKWGQDLYPSYSSVVIPNCNFTAHRVVTPTLALFLFLASDKRNHPLPLGHFNFTAQ